jgi:CDP-glycerol glycerophosphotransferase (TagB/SpsB family)
MCVAYIGAGLWWIIGRVVAKRSDLIVLNTFPDFDDTARALVPAAEKLGYEIVVLTTRRSPIIPYWAKDINRCYRYSMKGVWLYHRAKLVFYTHGLFSFWPLNWRQCVVNLWHGMPIKRIGLLDGKSTFEIPRFHYTIATNHVYQEIVARSFGVPLGKVLLLQHPRLDVLLAGRGQVEDAFPHRSQKWLAVWLPTYRSSSIGDIRKDGASAGDPFTSMQQLLALDDFFFERSIACVIKPHPMAEVAPFDRDAFKALIFFDEAKLAQHNLSLYQLLALSDFLITDVSSVYVDYAVLDRPRVVYCEDVQDYGRSRGFSAPLESLVSDRIAVNQEELRELIDDVLPTLRLLGSSLRVPVSSTSHSEKLLVSIAQRCARYCA